LTFCDHLRVLLMSRYWWSRPSWCACRNKKSLVHDLFMQKSQEFLERGRQKVVWC